MVLEIRLYVVFHIVLILFLLGGCSRDSLHPRIIRTSSSLELVEICATIATIYLFLAQIPQVNLSIVDASGQLVDIGEVLEALDEVIDEPRSVLRSILDVLFSLLVPGDLLLLEPTWRHPLVLIRHVIIVTNLQLVVMLEEQIYVPGENGTLSTAREEQLLLSPLDVAQTLLCRRHM